MEKPRYDVFLSHATRDKPVVEELARLLKKRGFEPWLDKWNLIPGEPWQEAIEEALRNCATCAVCLGASATGPWQNAEMRAAIDHRVSGGKNSFRVIPVLLPGAGQVDRSQLSDFLTATTWVEFRETLDDEQALYRLLCGIQGIPPGPGPGEAIAEGARPYRGLQVFDVDDALFFFGREELTARLLEKLQTDRAGTRFLAIVGPSGSGKSSLARAGLIASLKRGRLPGSGSWPIAICKPGAEPLQSFSLAFGKAFGRDTSEALKLIGDLAANSHALHIATHLSLDDAPTDRRLVVLVDQFEEVFTLCADEGQRRAFIDNLLYAARVSEGQTVVILSMRADFYGRCAAYPDLAAAMSDHQSLIGPMSRDELRSAIQRPAYLTGCELEGGLADLLLNEVNDQPGSLPLLEHALLEIWQRREGGRRLTVAAYHEIGGVAGALEKRAEEVYSGFTEEEKEACRRVFLRLVQVNEQGRATKRRLGLDDLVPTVAGSDGAVKAVVASLTNTRLLTTDKETLPTVELAHEALLANWSHLKKWIEQDREALRTRRRLDEAVTEWLGKNRNPSFLLEKGRLAQMEDWAAGHLAEIGPDARELLDASVAERDDERQRELAQAKALEEEQRRRADAEHQRAEEQTRAGRRLKRWTVAFAVTAALAIAAALAVFHFRQASERQRKIDLASHLAERSSLVGNNNLRLGLLLSIEAIRLAEDEGQPHLPSAEEALRSALFDSHGIPLPTGKIRAAALSRDRRRLALAGTDGIISLWNLEAGSGPVKVGSLTGSSSIKTRQLAISSGGKWLLVADKNGNSHLFHLADAKTANRVNLDGEDWLIGNDPFSPSGQLLLTRKDSRWLIRSLFQPGQPIVASLDIDPRALAFSPDGQWLASSETESLRIWDLKTLGSSLHFSWISRAVSSDAPDTLAFSSDSQWLVAGGGPNSFVQAWRVRPALASSSPIYLDGCSWKAPDNPDIFDPSLVSHIKNLARCLISNWDMKPEEVLVGSSEEPGDSDRNLQEGAQQKSLSYLFAVQGSWFITQSDDEAPMVFSEKITDPDPASSGDGFSIEAFSQGGLQLRKYWQTKKYWLHGQRESWPLPYTEEGSAVWRFSPDGRWLATLSDGDLNLLVWHIDADGPSTPISLSPQRSSSSRRIIALAFSPDGRLLGSGDAAGESRFWDLQHPEDEPVALVNHQVSVKALAFNQDGHLIATAGNDGRVRISKIIEGQTPKVLPDSPGNRGEPIEALTFLTDNRLAISLSDRIIIWKPDQEIAIEGPHQRVRELVSNPKGTSLAAVAEDGDVRIWYSANNGDLLRIPVLISASYIGSSLRRPPLIRFTSDGNSLETTDGGKTLRRWELRTDKLLKTACRAAGRNLTEREWREYIPSEPYQEREPCPEFPKAYD